MGFQRISFETREELASYGPESLLGKRDIIIKRSLLSEGIERPSRKQTFDRTVMVHHAENTIHSVIYFFEKIFPSLAYPDIESLQVFLQNFESILWKIRYGSIILTVLNVTLDALSFRWAWWQHGLVSRMQCSDPLWIYSLPVGRSDVEDKKATDECNPWTQ